MPRRLHHMSAERVGSQTVQSDATKVNKNIRPCSENDAKHLALNSCQPGGFAEIAQLYSQNCPSRFTEHRFESVT